MNNTDDLEEIDFGMSNFDGVIDEGFSDALKEREGKVYGSHSAWNYYGKVYFYKGKFHEIVMTYGAVQGTISADSLPELMSDVCDVYGGE